MQNKLLEMFLNAEWAIEDALIQAMSVFMLSLHGSMAALAGCSNLWSGQRILSNCIFFVSASSFVCHWNLV